MSAGSHPEGPAPRAGPASAVAEGRAARAAPRRSGAMRQAPGPGNLRHLARLYDGPADYLAAAAEFARRGLSRDEAVMLAVPEHKISWLRPGLPESDRVGFTDLTELGRNPARIIPSIRAFLDAHLGQRVSYLEEPVWPGRSAAELCEAARHEALVNQAFAERPATIVCLYDAAGLSAAVMSDMASTHPVLIRDGREVPSTSYLRPPRLPPGCDRAFDDPPADAVKFSYTRDLHSVRAMAARTAQGSGLPAPRATDFVIAVSEVAANTLRHTSAGGSVYLWCTEDEIICQIADTGVIADPLAGRRLPTQDLPGGRGLWLANQLCDLLELRTGQAGTKIRLRMRLR
jgi:anti-sigma regulatory factor (Ser/Thr protein kinase)